MRKITCNAEAAPWSRTSHLMGTRLFPSGDNSDNNLFGTLEEQVMVKG
jgi:hypothetical protein